MLVLPATVHQMNNEANNLIQAFRSGTIIRNLVFAVRKSTKYAPISVQEGIHAALSMSAATRLLPTPI